MVCDEITARLKELRDPQTGEKIVTHIYPQSEIFWGPFVDDAPDVAFLLAENYKALGTLEFASNKIIEPAFGNAAINQIRRSVDEYAHFHQERRKPANDFSSGIDGDAVIMKISSEPQVKIRVARAAIAQVEATEDAK